jgi:hypothetical protein
MCNLRGFNFSFTHESQLNRDEHEQEFLDINKSTSEDEKRVHWTWKKQAFAKWAIQATGYPASILRQKQPF